MEGTLNDVANRLAQETSPYLLQHAHNPVDWYAWGSEALARAQAEDKPILLSIGYSACHWCHVMERESFENEQIASLMNASFVCIKVDREERPDLDGIYMQAVQAMTGQGGWPMTVFLAPDGTPFYGGTYYPPSDRGGMPGFPRVLLAIADAWQNRRNEILASGARLREQLQHSAAARSQDALDVRVLDAAAEGLIEQYDPAHGGLGRAPKFPQPMALEFLLRWWNHTHDETALKVVTHSLMHMAQGGIYDHLGGGFARYSTDPEWLVPHFEKMLYDNAQLARAYLLAYQATGTAFFRDITVETVQYVLRDMTDSSGGFYSTEDADSEGEEGRFYLWTPAEVESLLGPEDARLLCAYYDVREPGNFEHRASILRVQRTPEEVAQQLGVTEVELLDALERGRKVLFEARSKRIRPARDEKVLAAWNGMMLRAVAEAAAVLDRRDFLQAAIRNGEFLLHEMCDSDGRLHRTWKPGHAARLNAYLEDYANVADGLLALYEATFETRWLDASIQMVEHLLTEFPDTENGGFFDTSTTHETLITRPKDIFDNATPSGNAVAADVLLRLSALTDNGRYHDAAQGVLTLLRDAMARYPLGFARALNALDFYLDTVREVAIVGDPGSEDTHALRRAVFEPFVPNKVVAGSGANIALLEGREPRNGQAAAYVCQHYVCQAPTGDPAELRKQLVREG